MSDTDMESEGNTGMRILRFHGKRGDDYALWRHRLRATCCIKEVWSMVKTTSSHSESTEATSDSAAACSSRVVPKREKACGIIMCALGGAPLRVVMDVDDDPARMIALLDALYASNRTISRLAVQTQLFCMLYTVQNKSNYVDKYTALFRQLKRMGKKAAIPESNKVLKLLASIDSNSTLESTAAALRTKIISELTSESVATTLIDEYNAKQVSPKASGRSSRRKKKGQIKYSRNTKSTDHVRSSVGSVGNVSGRESDVESTARAFSAALRFSNFGRSGTSNGHHCDFCDRDGHTQDRCYMNPDNPDNHLPQSILDHLKTRSKKTGNSDNKNGSRKSSVKSGKIEIAAVTVDGTTLPPPKNLSTCADRGATAHCLHSSSAFVPGSVHPCEKRTVMLADNTSVEATQCGDMIVPFESSNLCLTGVLLIHSVEYHLVATGCLADKGIESHFSRHTVRLIFESNGIEIGVGLRHENSGMYMLPEPIGHATPDLLFTKRSAQKHLWHQRLAHVNPRDLREVHKYAEGVPPLSEVEEVCRAFRLGKAHKLPSLGHFEHAAAVGDIVHSDIVGPLNMSFPDGFRYACTFLDEHSRYDFIVLMTHHSDISDVFDAVNVKLNHLGGVGIKSLHSDGAEEYKALQQNLAELHVNTSFSAPYTPQHNAIADRINRSMEEAATSLLL